MILVLGADGYIGTEFISQTKHDFVAVDNYYKRILLEDMRIKPLYEVPYLHERGVNTAFVDLTNYEAVERLIKKYQPTAVLHLAENPSAPYSMTGQKESLHVIENNLFGTLNLIHAIYRHSPETHIIKLGTLGQYGCPNIEIAEGWFNVEYKGRVDRLLFPRTPHSWYHLSKAFDTDALAFSCRMYGLRVTDLQQGFVWGLSPDSKARFCYDAQFGTILNRFMIQALIGHPLTVYGRGGQTRGLIHIRDTVQCLHLAIENPPDKGEYRVANQLTEWKTLNDLAEMVKGACKHIGIDTAISHIDNPRIEKEEHYYNVEHKVMADYGLQANKMTQEYLINEIENLKQYKANIEVSHIMPTIRWN